MANTLTSVTPQLLAQGLLALREESVMARLVNRDYDGMAAQKGATVDVPIPSAITAAAVTAANTAPSTADISPTSVAISLDQWYEAPFYLTDKELLEVSVGTLPMQASAAVKAIANNIDSYILGKYTGVYGYEGTAGTTPFASTTAAATSTRKTLNNQLAPVGDRRLVVDPDAEAEALELRAFQDASFRGDIDGIVNGQIGRKLGFDWFMDQNVPTHTTTGTGTVIVNDASTAVGDTTITWDGGGTAPALGDVFTVAGDTQTYVVVSSTSTVITMLPTLQSVAANNAALTFKATHVVNLGFHRDAFALAMRPLENAVDGLGNQISVATDPISGVSMRLEVSREHKRTRYSFDVLYGAKLVRAELACRMAG
jgi:hypothetical protein